MKIIGLTGGIGSGKSTVSGYLKEKGYKVSDADLIAHQITEPGTETLDELVSAFGNEILDSNGRLRRKYLASIVFTDAVSEKTLNRITHKGIKKQLEAEIEENRKNGERLMFLEGPILFEAGVNRWCDYMWLVTADMDKRLQRVMQRDDASEEQVKQRIACQMSDEEKIRLSDEVLDNSGNREELCIKVDELLEKYENKISR